LTKELETTNFKSTKAKEAFEQTNLILNKAVCYKSIFNSVVVVVVVVVVGLVMVVVVVVEVVVVVVVVL